MLPPTEPSAHTLLNMQVALPSSQNLSTLAKHPLASSTGLNMVMNFESEHGDCGVSALSTEYGRQTIGSNL
jgi:hypothetical protein